jgi:iron(III) transport system ATP-binding protein
MIAGFQQPSAGEILFDEANVTRVPANRRDIGFVFQNYALFPHLSVFENVAYGLRIKRHGAAEIERAVEEGLRQVDLQGLGARAVNELSGGQQQRVALARAIAIKPRVLLFDEPLSNLDAKLRVQMRSEISRLQKELAITTIYVTHDQEEAMAVSDRIAIMNEGRIVQIGRAEDLYQKPSSRFVANFLGDTNLVQGTVLAADAGRVTLAVGGYHWSVSTDAALAIGSVAEAVARPEAIALARNGRALPGVVEARVFLGDKAEYRVRAAGLSLQVVQWNPAAADVFAVGDNCTLDLPTSNVQIFQ